MVGGLPVPEVNRIVNAFIAGAKEVNPEANVKITFINSWFDPAAAKEAALAQIDGGADVLFAERFGVIEAAKEKGLYAFGNMSDQNELAPDLVVSSPVWNMDPTVDYLIKPGQGRHLHGPGPQRLQHDGQGRRQPGADQHRGHQRHPAELIDQVTAKEDEIKSGSSASTSTRPSRRPPARASRLSTLMISVRQ